MKKIIASVFFDILSYTIGNNILCIFKNFELYLIIFNYFKKMFALLILIVFSVSLGIEYFNFSELRY